MRKISGAFEVPESAKFGNCDENVGNLLWVPCLYLGAGAGVEQVVFLDARRGLLLVRRRAKTHATLQLKKHARY